MPSNSGTILLVEDEALIALAESRILEKEGYSVLRAGSGEEAVEIASSNPGIDLVLMDVDLGPGMDGTRAARRILESRDVPILFLSSHVEPEVVARTEAVTSYGYVVKNSGTMVLLASIKMAFRLRESNRKAALSARRFEAVSGTTMEGFWISDSEGRILEVNRAYSRMTGYNREELLGMRISDLEAVLDETAIREEILRIRQLGSGRFETRHRAKDGRTIDVEVNATDVPDQGFTICFLRDITELKRAEEALRLNEARLEGLLRLSRMTDAPIDVLAKQAMEEAVRLTRSKIGYVAFVSEDEAVLTMHAWSEEALRECAVSDKPLVYPVASTGLWGEAVRQRRAVITNDYGSENPWKRGLPPGHVPLFRHMNVPVFDGNRIVVVAGVANKAADYDESDVRQLSLLMTEMWRMVQHKRTEDLRREREQYSEILNRMTAEMLERGTPEDLYRYIVRCMEERYPNTVILFISIDEKEGQTRLESVAGLERNLLLRALDLIGYDPVGRTYRLVTTHDEYFRSGRLLPFRGGLAEFCAGQFPEPAARAVEKLLGLRRIYTIGLNKDRSLLGALHFLTFRGTEIRDAEFVEAFVRQAGLVLRQKAAEAEARVSENRIRTLSDNLPGGIVYQVDFGLANRERRFTYISGGVEKLHGVSAEEVLADPAVLYGQFPEEERLKIASLEDEALRSMSRFYVEARFRKPDGTDRWGLLSSMPRRLPSGHVLWDGIEIDITELKKAEENSARLLREKELVLKEVHHRIKNNLGAVESMLRLQADLRKDPGMREILQDAAGRVVSMEVLYDKLYRTGDFGELSVREYLETLLPEIIRCHARSESIRPEVKAEDFRLGAKTLSALGILLYELVNNALKHAFEGRTEGTIRVSASRSGDRVRVVLADDGIGLPPSVTLDNSSGFGMRLVGMLVEQLGGGIRVERDGGTRFVLEFPEKPSTRGEG